MNGKWLQVSAAVFALGLAFSLGLNAQQITQNNEDLDDVKDAVVILQINQSRLIAIIEGMED